MHDACFQGLSDAVLTPSLDDLRAIVDCNYERITRALVAKNVGVLLGALAGALLLDMWKASDT